MEMFEQKGTQEHYKKCKRKENNKNAQKCTKEKRKEKEKKVRQRIHVYSKEDTSEHNEHAFVKNMLGMGMDRGPPLEQNKKNNAYTM